MQKQTKIELVWRNGKTRKTNKERRRGEERRRQEKFKHKSGFSKHLFEGSFLVL